MLQISTKLPYEITHWFKNFYYARYIYLKYNSLQAKLFQYL